MALTFTTTDYNQTLFNLLKDVEGAKPNCYLDVKGIPTIGIGFNLKDNQTLRERVFSLFGLDWNSTSPLFTDLTPIQRAAEDAYIAQITTLVTSQYPANPTAAERKAFGDTLNGIMAGRWKNLISQLTPADQALTRSAFSFADNTDTGEMRPIFDSIIPSFEKNVDNWLAGIPPSREKAALVSIAYDRYVDTATAIAQGNQASSGPEYLGATILAGGGNDVVVGSSGNDYISGGAASDLLIGGAGNVANDSEWRVAA